MEKFKHLMVTWIITHSEQIELSANASSDYQSNYLNPNNTNSKLWQTYFKNQMDDYSPIIHEMEHLVSPSLTRTTAPTANIPL